VTTVAKGKPDTLASLVSNDARELFAVLSKAGRRGTWSNEVNELNRLGYKMIPFDKIGIQKDFVFLHATHVVKVGGASDYEAEQYEKWPQDSKGMIARTETLTLDGEPINAIVQERCTPIGDVRRIIAKVITDSHEGNWGVRQNSDGSYSLVIFDFVM
jgi:hypothetical protein